MKLKKWTISALIVFGLLFAHFAALAAPTPAPAKPAKTPAAPAAQAAAPAAQPGLATPGAQAMPAQPAPTSLSEAYVTVVVGDIPGFIDAAGPIVTQVSPSLNAGELRSLLGQMFNDPTLAGLPPQSGAAVVIFAGKVQASFLEVAPASAQAYLDSATTLGMKAALVNDGLLVIAEQDNGLAAGKNIAAEVKSKLLAGKGEPNIKAVVRMQRIIEQTDPNIQVMLQSVAQMIAMQTAKTGVAPEVAQSQAKIVEAELRGAYSLAQQISELNATLSPVPQQGLRLSFAAKPIAGTNLAALGAAPAPAADGLLKMLPGKGAMRATASVNMKALLQLMQSELSNVSAQMNISDEDLKAMQDLLAGSMAIYGNSFAMDFMVPGKSMMSGAMLYSVTDPAAAIAQFEKLASPQGGFMSMYRNMGVDLATTFTKNARSYKNVPIHRFNITTNMQNLPPQQAEQMRKLVGDMSWELAIVNNTLIYAMAEPIDALIDAVQSKANAGYKPLRSQTAFSPGANFYLDFDLSVFARSFAIMETPGQPSPFSSMASALQGAEPLMMSGAIGAQELRFNMLLPSSLIAGFGKLGGMAAGPAPGMQAPPSQQQMAPPPAPPKAPAGAAPRATPKTTPRAAAPARPAGR